MRSVRTNASPRRSRPKWQRPFSLALATLFAWTALLAVPAQALSRASRQKPLGVRALSPDEMQRITGRVSHALAVSAASGPTYPWEASAGGINTGNGNKLTQVPLVGWTARGGMPVSFTLAHNSQGVHNSELG